MSDYELIKTLALERTPETSKGFTLIGGELPFSGQSEGARGCVVAEARDRDKVSDRVQPLLGLGPRFQRFQPVNDG